MNAGILRYDGSGQRASSRKEWRRAVRHMAKESYRVTQSGGPGACRLYASLPADAYDDLIRINVEAGWWYLTTWLRDEDGLTRVGVLSGQEWAGARPVVGFALFMKGEPASTEDVERAIWRGMQATQPGATAERVEFGNEQPAKTAPAGLHDDGPLHRV